MLLRRRSVIATVAGLALSVSRGNSAAAQSTPDDLPDAAEVLNQIMPTGAPEMNFITPGGKKLSLKSYAGHGLVVNLWATWCGPCIAEIPSFAVIAPELARSKILVLPISIDLNGAAAVQPFYARSGITTLPVLLDPQGDLLGALNTTGIPATIIINAAGQLVAQLNGAANWNTPGTIAALKLLAGAAKPAGGVQPV